MNPLVRQIAKKYMVPEWKSSLFGILIYVAIVGATVTQKYGDWWWMAWAFALYMTHYFFFWKHVYRAGSFED